MSVVTFTINGVAPAAAAAEKTIIQILAAAARPISVLSISLSMSVVPSATGQAPLLAQVARQATAGTMTALTGKELTINGVTVATTGQHTATAEPTKGDIELQDYFDQRGGRVSWGFGPEKFRVAAAGRLGIIVVSPTGYTVTNTLIAGTIVIEE